MSIPLNLRYNKEKLDEEIFDWVEEVESIEEFNELLTDKKIVEDNEGNQKIVYAHPNLVFVLFATNPPCMNCMQQAYIIYKAMIPTDIEIYYVDVDRHDRIVQALFGVKNPPQFEVPKFFFFKNGKRVELVYRQQKDYTSKSFTLFSVDSLMPEDLLVELLYTIYHPKPKKVKQSEISKS